MDTEKKRILIVDDDEMAQMVTVLALGKLGYPIDTANDGREGLEKALAGDYACIVTDNTMPRMTGIEMAAQLRSKGFAEPIILVTGDTEEWIAASPHVIAVVPKPFDIYELLGMIRSSIG